ncbi:unnamed protein product, partial [Ectocarpus fasciculatus]
LDASQSFHFDDPTHPLIFSWTCVELAPASGGPCDVTFSKTLAVIDFVYLNASASERVWEFTVSVSSSLDASVDTASDQIIVKTAVDIPFVSFDAVPRKVNPLGELIVTSFVSVFSDLPVAANWSVLDSEESVSLGATTPVSRVFGTGEKQLFTLGVAPNFFVGGRSYTIQLSLSRVPDMSTIWINQLVVEINRPPYGGILDVYPNSGQAFDTVFFLQTHSWKADPENYPLTYGFRYHTDDAQRIHMILADGDVSRVNAVLGAGVPDDNFVVVCTSVVTDIFESSGEAVESVTVV